MGYFSDQDIKSVELGAEYRSCSVPCDVAVLVVKHQYSCGGYWLGILDEDGGVRCISPQSGLSAVMTEEYAGTRAAVVANRYDVPLRIEWRHDG